MFIKINANMTRWTNTEFYVNLDKVERIVIGQAAILIKFGEDNSIELTKNDDNINYITDILNKYNKIKYS